MSLQKLKSIDKRTKYSVYVWIRNKEKTLGLRNIPSLISSICILYFRDEEIFNVPVISNKGIKLSKNKKTITKIDEHLDCNNNNYGIIGIESDSELIVQWDLKAIKISDCVAIGIASKQFPNKKMEHCQDSGCFYYFFYQEAGDVYQMSTDGEDTVYSDEHWMNGDKISIKVDFKEDCMRLFINDVAVRGFTNIQKSEDIKYQLFVCLYSIGDTIEITDFTKH